jgi:hypothetical protein
MIQKYFVLIALLGQPALAEVYRCEVDGQVIFSDQKCGDDHRVVEIAPPPPSVAPASSAEGHDAMDIMAAAERISANNRKEQIARKIRQKRIAINVLQDERDAELARLRATMGRANDNLAGATWQQSLATEMQAVNQRYDSEIAIAQDEIRDLQSQLAAIE